jgi:type IV secretion system protein VirB5
MYTTWRLLLWAGLLVVPAARAQFAVIDVTAITQMIQQAEILQQQLTTAQSHLAQARLEFESITGARGMEQLLSGTQRNYLPASWADLQGAMAFGGGGVLGSGIAASVAENSVLPPQALAVLPPDVRKEIDTARRLTALQQNLTRIALATASQRFNSLQQLINAIAGAKDQKAVLDLQARVGSENTMLQNEQSKLVTLFQLVQAEEHANEQQMRERALLGQGQFATRFRPTP